MEKMHGFTCRSGLCIDNIINLHCDDFRDFRDNLGAFITESKTDNNHMFKPNTPDGEGIYLYHTTFSSSLALRIYKDVSHLRIGGKMAEQFVCHDSDAVLISKLLSKQNRVSLTDFPLGIVTIGSSVVGQVITFYEDAKTVADTIISKRDIIPTEYYLKVLEIIRELAVNEIIYGDAHLRNFIITHNNIIKPIDFEPGDVIVPATNQKRMITNFKSSINFLNNQVGIDFNIDKPETIDECQEELSIWHEKIKKRIKSRKEA